MVLLFGCTAAPEPLSPYALSDAEVTAVVRGFYSSVKDRGEPQNIANLESPDCRSQHLRRALLPEQRKIIIDS